MGKGGHFTIERLKRVGSFRMAEEHFHDNFEIYYLLSGTREYFIGDRVYCVRKGELVFIDRYDLHKTADAGGDSDSHERVLVNFQEAFLNGLSLEEETAELLRGLFREGRRVVPLSLAEQNRAEGLLFALLEEEEASSPPPYSSLSKRALLAQLLVFAKRVKDKEQPSAFEHVSPKHRKISEVIEYLNNRFRDNVTLTGTAELHYVSPFHLSRTFKQITGLSFVQYLHFVRVREARRLLRETNLSITEVAGQAGFDNLTHFGRVFKEATKLSPREYRKGGLS